MVKLNFYISDVRKRRSRREQTCKGRVGERGRGAESEIVRGLGLDMAGAGGLRQCRDKTVRRSVIKRKRCS